MPVIQISEIVHRRGSKDSLPNLAEAELGLTLDTSQVFIGTPNFPQAQSRAANNKFPFANTQILTEFSPNTEELINYSYRYRQPNGAPGGAASPLALNSQRIIRLLQERLDEVVSVKAYGAVGNGYLDFATVTDLRSDLTALDPLAIQKETYAIRRAAIDVANTLNDDSSPNGWVKRALYFPAGVYVIEDYAVLPPNSAWIGDGKGQTFIVLASATNTNIPVFQTASGDLTLADLEMGMVDNFVGSNIINYVSNVIVSGITFIHAWNQDVVRLIRMRDSVFTDCEFRNLDQVVKTTGNWSNTDSIGVVIDTAMGNMLPPNNIHFNNCAFTNSTYAVFATSDSSNISFDQCTFTGHYRAVRLGETVGLTRTQPPTELLLGGPVAGPSSFRITNSLFRNCYAEAFSALTANNIPSVFANYQGIGGFHISQSNRYENCGHASRDFLPTPLSMGVPIAPVVYFAPGTVYCVSLSDTFDRNAPALSFVTQRVAYTIGDPHIIFNPQDTVYYPGSGASGLNELPIAANTGGVVDFVPVLSLSGNNTVTFIDYSYEVDGNIRVGTLQIAADGTNVNFTDNSTFIGTGPDPVTLFVNMFAPNYRIQYENTSLQAGNFKYTIRFWNAF